MKKIILTLFALLVLAQLPVHVLAAEYSPRHCHGGGRNENYRDNDDRYYHRGGYGHCGYRR